MKFNVNNSVRVRLTEYGKGILREQFDKLHAQFPNVDKKFSPPIEDENGWSKWQLFRLMNTFGDYCRIGLSPFETEIELIED